MTISDTKRLKRSYERNLGHSRFWAGVGTVLLAGLLLFVARALWEVGKNPEVWTPLAEIAYAMVVIMLGQAIAVVFGLSGYFRNLYLRDDQELSRIEQNNQEVSQ